jgi:hypothetical protein
VGRAVDEAAEDENVPLPPLQKGVPRGFNFEVSSSAIVPEETPNKLLVEQYMNDPSLVKAPITLEWLNSLSHELFASVVILFAKYKLNVSGVIWLHKILTLKISTYDTSHQSNLRNA